MKKNRLLRAATVLLVLTLITSCFVGGTFAKYTTSANSQDTARVAKWGFNNTASINLSDLFMDVYTGAGNNDHVKGSNGANVIAPGSTNSTSFQFTYGGDTVASAPEVAYTFEVSTGNSDCPTQLANHPTLKWALYQEGTQAANITWGTWSQLITKIQALDGNKDGNKYEANTLPDAFNNNQVYVVAWKWDFESADNKTAVDGLDTGFGNDNSLEVVTLNITITATQID